MSLNIFQGGNSPSIDSARYFGDRQLPDPFVTYSTLMMPKTIEDVLRWSECLFHRNGVYAQVMRRVVAYFATKIEITETSEDQKKKWESMLNDTLDVIVQMQYAGIDYQIYGNSFTSLYIPFRRFLACSECGVEQPINKVNWKFKNYKFEFTCAACECKVVMDKPIDRRTLEEDKVRIIRWSPHQIKIRFNPISRQYAYLWDPPAYFIRQIQDGDPMSVESTPWEVIESIKAGKKFQFAPKVMYHMKEEGPAGLYTNGWGVTRFLTNFSQAFHVQLLKLYNEVLCTEYIIPFRVITPAPGTGAGDPMVMSNLGSFNGRVAAMLREFRKRPGGWNFLPFPINYQALGGEGMQMSPHELIDQAMDEMLNAAGFPAELYKGTLQMQAMPAALRLFQQSWTHLVSAMNGWLKWLTETLSTVFNWDKAKAALEPVTLADDLTHTQLLLQLAAANQVSKHRAFAPLGIDVDEDAALMIQEQETAQDQQAKAQARAQHKAMLEQELQSSTMQAAGVPQGGAGGVGASGGTDIPQGQISPQDMMGQADKMVQQLSAMSDGDRRSELLKIKRAQPALHAIIRIKLDENKQQTDRQGGEQLRQQQNQQQPPPTG